MEVMIWVMQAGRWGFGALFHKHFSSKKWPQAEGFSPAGWSSNTAGVGLSGKGENVGWTKSSEEESWVVTAS